MPLYLFYTKVQKSQKWPKTQIKGGPALTGLSMAKAEPGALHNAAVMCAITLRVEEGGRGFAKMKGVAFRISVRAFDHEVTQTCQLFGSGSRDSTSTSADRKAIIARAKPSIFSRDLGACFRGKILKSRTSNMPI